MFLFGSAPVPTKKGSSGSATLLFMTLLITTTFLGVIEPGARTNSEPGPGSCRIQCQSVVFLVPGGEPQPGGQGLPGGEWRW